MSESVSRRSKAVKQRYENKNSNFALWLIGISVIVIGLFIAWINLRNRPVEIEPMLTPEAAVPPAWINGKSLGNPDAPVVVQAWEDFLCPHCREWSATIVPRIFNDYIKRGDVRLEFHSLPLQGFEPGSSMAALAAECAADQNLFWPYHDRLFEAQDQGQAGYTPEELTRLATVAGLDESQFSQCMTSQQHLDSVHQSVQQANGLGITGTPTVFVNGQLVTYPFDYAGVQAEIDRQLAAAQ
jgi:protein-disulfide isomerase